MLSRIRFIVVLVLLLSAVSARPVFAGGWAVITLDELPTNVVAGQPLTIGFTVLQHGKTPMLDLTPTITANLYKDEEFVVAAQPEGKPGHYTATLTFPREGEWRWSIQAFTMDQAMPMLTVAPAVAAVKEPVAAKANAAVSVPVPMTLTAGATLALALVGAVIAVRRRSRVAAVLTVVLLVAGITLLITGTGTASGAEAQAISAVDVGEQTSLSQIETGRQLFIAKGCITCHYNSKAASPKDYWTIDMGAPNLSNFSASPEVLRVRLKDPASAKSDTKMPDLGLKETEIEALITFINSK